MNVPKHHAEWLSLIETSGPFLSMPVLTRVFPQGLDERDPARASRLREAYEEWLERQGEAAAPEASEEEVAEMGEASEPEDTDNAHD